MARKINRLTALGIIRLKVNGLYPDGGGLYLQITGIDADDAVGARSWLFRFTLHGRTRDMGLGPLSTVNLAAARQKAADCRKQLLLGVDPIEARRAERSVARLAAAATITFKVAAETYIETNKAGWRNDKHAAQWGATLETYFYPVIRDLPVQEITTEHVLKILRPIWATKTETASRIRGRTEAVRDAAKALGQRTGENPARWRGHLDAILPPRSKVQKVEHHAALPYADIPAFMADSSCCAV